MRTKAGLVGKSTLRWQRGSVNVSLKSFKDAPPRHMTATAELVQSEKPTGRRVDAGGAFENPLQLSPPSSAPSPPLLHFSLVFHVFPILFLF